MTSPSLINYNYASIADGVSQMRRVNENIRTQVDNLKREVDRLRAGFTGAASQSYDTCAAKISADLNQSNQKLDTLAGSVNRGAERMQSEDQSQSRRFGS